MTLRSEQSAKAVAVLRRGGIGILPTDTIYGLVGSALSRQAVERIYRLRRRLSGKPFIILIASMAELKKFYISLGAGERGLLARLWPGKISVILPCPGRRFRYLHRGRKSLAFRLPKSTALRRLLTKTGPLVAPSANPEGKKPAGTVYSAKKYFGAGVDFYVNGGRRASKPSTLAELNDGKLKVLRRGATPVRSLK